MRLNLSKQPRCGTHDETPFMYVGKVGQARRYLCPFYKCDRQGDEVARFVLDDQVATVEDPLAKLRKRDRKPSKEMAVFKSFVSAVGLDVDEGSEVSASEPYPDIRCYDRRSVALV